MCVSVCVCACMCLCMFVLCVCVSVGAFEVRGNLCVCESIPMSYAVLYGFISDEARLTE